jgi:hypothetical protein
MTAPTPLAILASLAIVTLTAGCAGLGGRPGTLPEPIVFYDFENPMPGDPARERDLGSSGTPLNLVNGGAAMRVPDGAHAGSTHSLQTRQVNPTVQGNDDWKAGVFSEAGVATLNAFNGAREVTIAGWVKPTGPHPGFNTNTPDPNDRYNAVGLMGLLSGSSTGHDVRALLEVINVADTLRLVALGRRIDEGRSQTFAARQHWQELLPDGEWTFLAATFDFDRGAMALYRNGLPLEGFYVSPGDPWEVGTEAPPRRTSATHPRGIKIGGSFPQNTVERNPFNGRFDDLMFFDRVLTPAEVLRHYRQVRR